MSGAGDASRSVGVMGGVANWMVGSGRLRGFTVMHCLHAAAETCFTISMAASIFFSVSADAARPRVLLFLVISLAPFLVMAPLVGPVIDRVRGGIGRVVVGTFAVRAILVLLLAQQLRTLALFPLAFGVLVVAKTYTVGRNALVPLLVETDDDLVAANARLSRTASIAGTIAGAAAVAVYTTAGGAWTLRLAAVFYVLGAIAAWSVRKVLPAAEAARRTDIVELLRVDFTGATWDMMALRAAVGFAMFHFAFSLRAGNEPAWLLGAVIAANSIGGFLGTVVAPPIRSRINEGQMFTWSMLGSAGAMVAAGIGYTRATLIGAVLILGLAASVGRRALDSTIQQFAPHASRGRVYASLETRLELAWVAAACVAVASRLEHPGRGAGARRLPRGDGGRARAPPSPGRAARATDDGAARRAADHPRRDAGGPRPSRRGDHRGAERGRGRRRARPRSGAAADARAGPWAGHARRATRGRRARDRPGAGARPEPELADEPEASPTAEAAAVPEVDHPDAGRARLWIFDSTRTSSTSPIVRSWVTASPSGRWGWIW